MRAFFVAGGRPNFMKIASLWHEMEKHDEIEKFLVHTGQHYDAQLSDIFFKDLNLPPPDENLKVGSSTHAIQTGMILERIEGIMKKQSPDIVYVVGDMNSTLAAALAAIKLHLPVAHVQAGWRSGDKKMPEEINRILTDHVSRILFPETYEDALNLYNEGIPANKVFMVGNTMIDSLFRHIEEAKKRSKILKELDLEKGWYVVVTAHRPGNVDNRNALESIVKSLCEISKEIPIVYPVHPRTTTKLKEFDLWEKLKSCERMRLTEPLGYLDFIKLLYHCRFALSDSGAVQEECIALGVPCLTMRRNTELHKSIIYGVNILVGSEYDRIVANALKLTKDDGFYNNIKEKTNPYPYWDGTAGKQITEISLKLCENGLDIDVPDFIKNGPISHKLITNSDDTEFLALEKQIPPSVNIVEVFNLEGEMIPLTANTIIRKGWKLKLVGLSNQLDKID